MVLELLHGVGWKTPSDFISYGYYGQCAYVFKYELLSQIFENLTYWDLIYYFIDFFNFNFITH